MRLVLLVCLLAAVGDEIPDRATCRVRGCFSYIYTQEDEEEGACCCWREEMMWREKIYTIYKTCLMYTAESVKEKLFLVRVLYISRSRLDSASGDVSSDIKDKRRRRPFFFFLNIYYKDIFLYYTSARSYCSSVAWR